MGMSIRLEATDETLGMRLHEVNRQRAVERALERLRHGLKADWQYLSQEDLLTLRWLIGELWAVSSRGDWEILHFSKLDAEDTRRIISLADRLRRHGTQHAATLAAVREILLHADVAPAAGMTGGAVAAH